MNSIEISTQVDLTEYSGEIDNTYYPEDLFGENALKTWASENNFIEDSDNPVEVCTEAALQQWAEENGYVKVVDS